MQIFSYFCNASFYRKPSGGVERCIYIEKTFTIRSFFVFRNFATFDPSKSNARIDVLPVCVYPTRTHFPHKVRLCVIHIGVGFLRCSFSRGGQCEGLKHGTGKGKIPTLFCIYLLSFFIHRDTSGICALIRTGCLSTRDNSSNKNFANKGEVLHGLQHSCAVHAPTSIKYSEKTISMYKCSTVFPSYCATTFSKTYQISWSSISPTSYRIVSKQDTI